MKPDKSLQYNLKSLYGIEKVPCDTYMRTRLDVIEPKSLRKTFKEIFSQLQRGKELEQFQFINGHYLLSIDGTGFFSSSTVNCKNCCVKNHRDKSKTYYHQMFARAIVHPKQSTVIPFAPEPVMNKDGNSKNDCEVNAAKRFIRYFKREHPHLKTIVVADSLHAKAPFINLLKNSDLSFILKAKQGDHKKLFQSVEGITQQFEYKTSDGKTHQYKYM